MLATTLLYPCVLACLCLGAGLLVDRLAGGWLGAALLPPVGAAALIGISQLTTTPSWLAPATPWVMLAAAASGLALGRVRGRELAGAIARHPLPVSAAVLAYLLALAPVLIAGRTSFSSFGALSDSAVHMAGADYLIHHGQSYGHLDLANSYGRFIKGYYATSYPSGADTLFGGSAVMLGLPLIWAFQPFNAFMLALGCGPAWLLVRRLGLRDPWAALAALTAVVPTLVYAYELLGSVKEITTLPLLLACGCLVSRTQWLERGARGVLPLALLFAAGVSALGVAFGAWALASMVVLVPCVGGRRVGPGKLLAAAAAGTAVVALAALPTWRTLGGALHVASTIAATSNAGNLHEPLHAAQVLGIWLDGSYKLTPAGGAGQLTDALIAVVLIAVLLGVLDCVRRRSWALGGWIVMMLLTWQVISHVATAWAGAKTLVLTSPVAMLTAWGGVALLAELRPRIAGAAAAAAAAGAITVGVLASDELQYNTANLAPTARYVELAKVNRLFAGEGPAIFTDFDEYSLYELRDLDLASPNFVYPSAALEGVAGGYGRPWSLDGIAPAALVSYPLIVTRRDPLAPRPPSAYRLAWGGSYYDVWKRAPGAAVASRHEALLGTSSRRCATIGALARSAGGAGTLSAAREPGVVTVALGPSGHPRSWSAARGRLVMKRPGTLRARVSIPVGGRWDLWLRGEFMPSIGVSVDGRRVGVLSGQLSGNSLITATPPPFESSLAAGSHTVEVHRSAPTLAPGDRGAAVLSGLFLSPAAAPAAGRLLTVPISAWPSLCGRALEWVESFRRG